MITGQVNEVYEAVLPIYLQDASGHLHEFEAILDTGFNGSLTLPSEVVALLGLSWRTRGSAELADGSEETFDIYSATILWDEAPLFILVSSVETKPLLGMRLLADYDVRMRVQPGGVVEIVAVPDSKGLNAS